MPGWLDRLLGRGTAADADERLLALAREAQGLRLQLQEHASRLTALREECDRLREGEEARVAEAVRGRLEGLLTEAAGPVAQLLTQAHLAEVEHKPVQVRDELAVARRLVRVLEAEGMTLEGQVGAQATYDPDCHAPLGGDTIAPGQPVVIRFV